jgi:penicillin G amidase
MVMLILLLDSSARGSWLMSSIKGKDTFIPALGKLLSPASGFWKNAETKKGPSLNNVRNKSLSGKVEIVYDGRMVPHIFAENTKDAMFAQGYVTAALRLWQMEFQTHAVSGRLTEFLGSTADRSAKIIEFDRNKRKQGLHIAAQKSVELWKKTPEMYELLESYTAGVNAYINSLSYDKLPLEYKMLDYRPEPWSVYKSALLLKAMAEDLVSKSHDFEMTNAYKYFGKDKFNSLFPEYFPEQLPVIMDSSAYNFTPVKVNDSIAAPYISYNGKESSGENPAKGLGSNNWAVSGKKTETGNPMLCNDPHLGLNLPSIWFEIQIVTPEFNAYGASLPGAPGIISGFNEYIAWGVTNVAHDVKDWYAIQWADDSKKEYIVDGVRKKSSFVYDTIRTKRNAPVVDTLIYTEYGPIAKTIDGIDYALRWTANEPSEEPITFFKLMKSKNYQDYLNAIKYFSCPAQNLVFACKDGDIALWTQGKLPLRRPDQGKFVMDGSISFNQYQGFIPQEHIPHEHNPAKGFVASANQHSVSPDYPYYTYGYFEEYRGRYLNSSLMKMKKISAADMLNLQKSNFGQKAADFLPLMLKYINRGELNKEELELLALFKNWNYDYMANEVAPTIFEDWFYNFNELIYDEIKAAQDKGIAMVYPEEWHLLGILKRDTANSIIDIIATDKKENIGDVLTESFRTTLKTIPRNKEKKVLTWAEMKSTALMHLARIPEFSVFNVPVDGSYHSLNAVNSRYDFEASRKEGKAVYKERSSSGPSWKMLVELGDTPKAQTIYPGGQSGNPGSHYYSNMIKDWTEGRYYNAQYLKKSSDIGNNSLSKMTMNK